MVTCSCPLQDAVALVHDMYDCLGHYGQKVPTADQVKHDDLQSALQEFLAELAQVPGSRAGVAAGGAMGRSCWLRACWRRSVSRWSLRLP